MNLHLVVPELLRAPTAEPAAARPAALERLLARGRRSSRPGASLESWLLERFGVDARASVPAAAYSLTGDGGDPGEAWWLRADPVHIEIGRDGPWIADATLFELSHAEADALVTALNAHFAPELAFEAVRPDRWYARATHRSEITATPIAQVRGRQASDQLPQGADAARWHAVLTEAQMLLHAHPVNAEREAHGALTINSIWLWGGGCFVAPARGPYAFVWSDDPLARGLAQAAGARHAPLPPTASALLAAAGRTGVAAVVLDALRVPAAYGDATAWRSTLDSLEREWFAPLLDALRAGRVGMVTLHAPGDACTLEAETTRQDLRYLWRRARPLAAYAQ